MNIQFQYRVIAAKVVDGDTVDLTLDVGFHHTMTDRFRLYGPNPDSPIGLNAPEMSTPEGVAAKAYLEKILADILADTRRMVIAKTLKDRREKFGRWLVVLEATYANDAYAMFNFNQDLLTTGNAFEKRYAVGEGPVCG